MLAQPAPQAQQTRHSATNVRVDAASGATITATEGGEARHATYIVIGAGPGGLQAAHLLNNYGGSGLGTTIVLEAAQVAGSFYHKFPRAGRLISINKVHNGQQGSSAEFNWRHDCNSLLTSATNSSSVPRVREYTHDYFPRREVYARYLADYAAQVVPNIHYGARVVSIQPIHQYPHTGNHSARFALRVERGGSTVRYTCERLIVATGLSQPVVPRDEIPGIELAEGYEEAPLEEPGNYTTQRVLILGNGNAAWETADALVEHAAAIHIWGRRPPRLAYATHYVGDVRAVNLAHLDTYQLKSMNSVINGVPRRITKTTSTTTGRAVYHVVPDIYGYPLDRIVRCFGWRFPFDDAPYQALALDAAGCPSRAHSRGAGGAVPPSLAACRTRAKYPAMTNAFESTSQPGLYFAGSLMHSRDARASSGGFIHGFRYLVRAMVRTLAAQHHGLPWPVSATVPTAVPAVAAELLTRVNNASGIYQMFGVLSHVAIPRGNSGVTAFYEDVPLAQLPCAVQVAQAKTWQPHAADVHFDMGNARRYYTLTLEYGDCFSGSDVLRPWRTCAGHTCANATDFIHPVVRYYEVLGNGNHCVYMEHHMVESPSTLFGWRPLDLPWLEPWLYQSLHGDRTPRAMAPAPSPAPVAAIPPAERCLALRLADAHAQAAFELVQDLQHQRQLAHMQQAAGLESSREPAAALRLDNATGLTSLMARVWQAVQAPDSHYAHQSQWKQPQDKAEGRVAKQ